MPGFPDIPLCLLHGIHGLPVHELAHDILGLEMGIISIPPPLWTNTWYALIPTSPSYSKGASAVAWVNGGISLHWGSGGIVGYPHLTVQGAHISHGHPDWPYPSALPMAITPAPPLGHLNFPVWLRISYFVSALIWSRGTEITARSSPHPFLDHCIHYLVIYKCHFHGEHSTTWLWSQ